MDNKIQQSMNEINERKHNERKHNERKHKYSDSSESESSSDENRNVGKNYHHGTAKFKSDAEVKKMFDDENKALFSAGSDDRTPFEKFGEYPLERLHSFMMGRNTKHANKTFYEVITQYPNYVKALRRSDKISPRSTTYLFLHYVNRLAGQ